MSSPTTGSIRRSVTITTPPSHEDRSSFLVRGTLNDLGPRKKVVDRAGVGS
jgi:hypothetical protein